MDVPVPLTSDTEFSVFLPMSVRTPGLAVAKCRFMTRGWRKAVETRTRAIIRRPTHLVYNRDDAFRQLEFAHAVPIGERPGSRILNWS